MAARKSGFFGANKLRKTLKRLDPEITSGVKLAVKLGAEDISNDAAAIAYSKGIYDTGDLVDSIEVQLGREGLTALIGPGAKRLKISKSPFNTTLYVTDRDKYAAWQFFKGYWAEFGTKGDPANNVPPQTPRPFMQPAYDANKGTMSTQIQKAVNRALSVAVASTSDV
jgi:HK97 gp10 family phage protein